MLDALSPYLPSLLGGLLIGLSAGGFYLLSGKVAGVSGVLGGAVLLQRGWWRWGFVGGLAASGVIAAILQRETPPALLALPPVTAIVAGVLAGFGSRLGSGCTSGHGVCGLARLSPRSLVAVLVFMTTAAATVYVVRHVGTGQ
jgi:uncharacterized membrane protein YedE/YeeE